MENLTKLYLPSSSASFNAFNEIKENGGKIGGHTQKPSDFDTKDYSIYPEGQRYQIVCVPQSWILENPDIDELCKKFSIDYDDCKCRKPLLLIPAENPILIIYEIHEEDAITETYYAEDQVTED